MRSLTQYLSPLNLSAAEIRRENDALHRVMTMCNGDKQDAARMHDLALFPRINATSSVLRMQRHHAALAFIGIDAVATC